MVKRVWLLSLIAASIVVLAAGEDMEVNISRSVGTVMPLSPVLHTFKAYRGVK